MSKAELVQEERQALQPVVTDSAAIMAVISKAASDPNTDVDKLERMMAMYERMEAKRAEQEYSEALRQAQQVMPVIAKTAENKQTNSMYAKLENITKAITPIITEHGFSMSFGTGDSPLEGHVRVVCDVSHVGGCTKRYWYDLPPDAEGIKGTRNKTDIHASASSLSYGRRYLTTLIFNLTIEGMDNDGNGNDNRTALDILNEWIAFMDVLRENYESIAAVRMNLVTGNYQGAKEAWAEIPREEQMVLYKAPSKGGILTTKERGQMKSNEWSEA